MSEIDNLSPERRVLLVVGGTLTPDSFGPEAYQDILAAVRNNSREHLDAFEKLFLRARPNRHALTDLHLEFFLGLVAPQAPERTREVARKLETMMASLARHQAGEAEAVEGGPVRAEDEVARQRRQLERRRQGIAPLLRQS
jgi:hypothetical protein